MTESAIRWRRARARDSAIRVLRAQGCHVWDVSHSRDHTTLLAYDPDGPTLREVIVCLDSTSMKSLGKLHLRRGVGLEVWHRNRGETAFQATKL